MERARLNLEQNFPFPFQQTGAPKQIEEIEEIDNVQEMERDTETEREMQIERQRQEHIMHVQKQRERIREQYEKQRLGQLQEEAAKIEKMKELALIRTRAETRDIKPIVWTSVGYYPWASFNTNKTKNASDFEGDAEMTDDTSGANGTDSFEKDLFSWKRANAGESDDMSIVFEDCVLKCDVGNWKRGHDFVAILVDWNSQRIVFFEKTTDKDEIKGEGKENQGTKSTIARLFWGIRDCETLDSKREILDDEVMIKSWNSVTASTNGNGSGNEYDLDPHDEKKDVFFDKLLFKYEINIPGQTMQEYKKYRPDLTITRPISSKEEVSLSLSETREIINKWLENDKTIPVMAMKYRNVMLRHAIGIFKERERINFVILNWNNSTISLHRMKREPAEIVTGRLVWGFTIREGVSPL